MAFARALVPVAAPPVRRVVRRSRRRSRSRPRACPGFWRVISAWLCSDCALACFLLRLLRRRAAVLRSGAFFLFSCFLFCSLLHARFRIHVHAHVQLSFLRCNAAAFCRHTNFSIEYNVGILMGERLTCMLGDGIVL